MSPPPPPPPCNFPYHQRGEIHDDERPFFPLSPLRNHALFLKRRPLSPRYIKVEESLSWSPWGITFFRLLCFEMEKIFCARPDCKSSKFLTCNKFRQTLSDFLYVCVLSCLPVGDKLILGRRKFVLCKGTHVFWLSKADFWSRVPGKSTVVTAQATHWFAKRGFLLKTQRRIVLLLRENHRLA